MTLILMKDKNGEIVGKVYRLLSGKFIALDLRTFKSSIHEDFESAKDWLENESRTKRRTSGSTHR